MFVHDGVLFPRTVSLNTTLTPGVPCQNATVIRSTWLTVKTPPSVLNQIRGLVYAEVLQESTVKGIQLQYIVLSSKGILYWKRSCQLRRLESVEVKGMYSICGPVR